MKKTSAAPAAKVSVKKASPASSAPASQKKAAAPAAARVVMKKKASVESPAPVVMKQKAPPKARVLYGECDGNVLTQQAALMEDAGYEVSPAVGRFGVEAALQLGAFDVVVLGHTLTRDDRHHLPYMAKKADPELRVMVIHASGKHPQVDAVVDSRYGENALLECLAGLLELVPA